MTAVPDQSLPRQLTHEEQVFAAEIRAHAQNEGYDHGYAVGYADRAREGNAERIFLYDAEWTLTTDFTLAEHVIVDRDGERLAAEVEHLPVTQYPSATPTIED